MSVSSAGSYESYMASRRQSVCKIILRAVMVVGQQPESVWLNNVTGR
jgi:hypothetical protein